MSTSLSLTPALVAYLSRINPGEHPVLRKCREETAAIGAMSRMQISAEQGAFMQWLARLIGARRTIEVGVFTGYSSLAMALTLKEIDAAHAHVLACDINADWTSRAKGYWTEAGVADVISLVLAPAAETLDAAIVDGHAATYDLAFIDADKTGYDAYYEKCLTLLRPGGVMLFDNVLWSGQVADEADHEADTEALRAINAKAHGDRRVHAVLTAIGDGLLMCRKADA